MRYAVFLQGVNLGGYRKVPMAQLREVLSRAGFGDVRTYIQSGNVVVDADLDPSAAGRALSATIEEAFGFAVPLVLVDAPQLAEVIAANPYSRAADEDPTRVHATFLEPVPDESVLAAVEADEPEAFELRGRVLYMHLPNGMGRSKLAEQLRRLKMPGVATTRNWRTVLAVDALMAGD